MDITRFAMKLFIYRPIENISMLDCKHSNNYHAADYDMLGGGG